MFSNLCVRKSHKNVKPKSAYMMILPDNYISVTIIMVDFWRENLI